DEQKIRETLQTYIDSMQESSAEKARSAFHPNAKITGYLEDGLHEMTTEDFAGFVAAQQPSPQEKGETIRLEILSIEIAGDTAAARIRDNYLGLNFLDSISLLKTDGRWSIYNKLFHVEGPAG
ncbi:MAG: nuclear transport factor 2 family protein, partial [Xanthomonadales bacterium]|nr:nuclear transport factor 2 family protein [Xanthomonadales bacterium]